MSTNRLVDMPVKFIDGASNAMIAPTRRIMIDREENYDAAPVTLGQR